MYDYEPYPKTPRLYGSACTVTEKMHGTNGVIIFDEEGNLRVGSRKRELGEWPGDGLRDNHGFWSWCGQREAELFELLGPGRHHGEFCGPGIEKNMHGFERKTFLPFNTLRWRDEYTHNSQPWTELDVQPVPELYRGEFLPEVVEQALTYLRDNREWSEGVCVYLRSCDQVFKATWAQDEERVFSRGKWIDGEVA